MIVRPWKTQTDRPLDQVTEWEVDTAGATDAHGRKLPRRRWKVSGSKAKATAVGKTRLAAMQAGTLDNYSKESREKDGQPVTLRTYVKKHYLPWVKEAHSTSTYVNRASVLEHHLIPKWGNVSLQKLQTPEVQRQIRDYLQDPSQHPTGRGLKKNSSRNDVLATLSAVLGHAASPETAPTGKPLVSKVKIQRLPQDITETPTEDMDGFEGVGAMRQHRIPKAQVDSLCKAAESYKEPELALALVKLGVKAGLRAGEMAGLMWKDVDFDRAILLVARAVCPRTEKIKATKTGRVATLPIEASLLEALKALKSKSTSEYVLGHEEGYRKSRELREIYAELTLEAWGEVSRRLHAMRHTFASDLADSGMPVFKIKRLCRHGSVTTSYGYMHPGESTFDEARAALSDGSKSVGATSRPEGGGGSYEALQAQILHLTQLVSKLGLAAE